MDIRTLRYPAEIVRQQSFTRAAERSFVVQPTISRILENLENELNCILLVRGGRRLLLTDTDRVVFECGLALLAEFRQLKAELSDISWLKTGVLRLGILPMVGVLVTGSIGLLRQRHPGVGLKTPEPSGLTVQQAAMSGELDIALTALPVEESGLATLSLFSHPLCTLTSHPDKWPECDAISPKTLAGHPLLIYDEDFTLSKQLMELFDKHGVKPKIIIRSKQWDLLVTMVQTGVGIAISSEPIYQQLDKNVLKWLPLGSELSWELGMIWREGAYPSHSIYAWLGHREGYWLTSG